MKNLKKLSRNELKAISGNGVFDNIGGVVTGLGSTVIGAVNGVSNVAGGAVSGAVTTVGSAVTGLGGVVETTLCNVQCVVNGVVTIKLLACGSTC